MTALTPLARHLLGKVTDRSTIPRYGSPEWDALPEMDPRRAASVVLAAECWRDYCSPAQVALDLLGEMEQADTELRRRIREASWAVCSGADWVALSKSPTHSELQRRREEA